MVEENVLGIISLISSISATILISILTIISWYKQAALKKSIDIKLSQYQSTSKLQDEVITILYEHEDFLDLLKKKYGDDFLGRISKTEREKINDTMLKINIILAKLFVVSDDESYLQVRDSVPIGKINIVDLREELLVAMRKAQIKDTRVAKRENIRFLFKI